MKCNSILKSLLLALVFTIGWGTAFADTWDGSAIASGFGSGKGTESEPYLISKADELVYFANNCGGKTWVVKLTADIDLGGNYWVNGTTTKYGSGKEFKGKFIADKKSDGTNYAISNFKLNVPNVAGQYGLLSKVTGGIIRNIDVKNVTIDFVANIATAAYVGALVGSTSTNTVVENCHATNVTMNLKGITANSGMGGLIGYFADKSTVTNCGSKDVTMTSSTTITVGGQGALIGSAAGKAHTISNCTVDNANITVNAEYKGGSLGGMIGYCQGGGATARASISGCTITNSTITATKLGAKAYIGLVVGQNSTYVDVANCSASGTDSKHSKIKITGAASETSGNDSYLGGVVGREQNYGTITGCTAEYVDIEIGGACSYTRIGGITGTMHLGSSTKFSGIKNSTVSHTAIKIGGAITGVSYIGGVVGYVDSYNELKNINVNTASITVTGLCTNANIGGLAGYVKGGAAASRTLVQGNTITSTSISVGGANASTNYIGGLAGIATTHVNLFNNKVENPAIAIKGAINGNSYFGGAVGNLATYTTIDGLYVTGGSITGPSATGTGVKRDAEFYVGGAVGRQQGSANSAATQQNQIRNVAVESLNINLGNFVPATGIMSNNKFSVGGVIGQTADVRSYKEECGIPENLISKDVKLYAPYAMTSPLVGGFGTPAYNTYTIDANTYNDDVQRSRVGSWVYSGYKLGLSAKLLDKTNAYDAASANGKVKRNYSKSLETIDGVSYLPVDDETFLKYNRMYDVEYTCKTVLWWTRTDNNASYANNDIDQTIYPQSSLTTTGILTDAKYPYTMYFYQGVNHGTSVTTDQATNLINGIAGRIAHANDETPVTLTITDPQEKVRGFDEHTISVAASDETDISYQWYVDGEASGTGSSITAKPDWRFGKGIVVNASKGGSIVASANYTLKHGVLHTKTSYDLRTSEPQDLSTDYVGMPTTQRGTQDNPYIIDCPEALRQFSWLSTLSNSFFWETVEKFGSDGKTSYQSAMHYNRAYYELSNDIDLGVGADEATRRANPGDFTPISHAGTNSGPTQGTYYQNSIFSGHFDGKGYAIKNFKVTWRGDRSSSLNQYFGLFGVVGWGITSTTETCVIQNLVIDNAQLVHDPNNTSFFYNNGASGNNNVQLGVLAGMVTANTTIQNVEVRNSNITDENDADGSTYNMAGKWLAVGGMIGRVQYYYKDNGDLANSVNLQFLSADCDVTLTHATFNGGSTPTLTRYFNVGGIVGSLCSSSAYASINMPQYAYYTGKVDAPLAMVGPVFATVDYSGNASNEKQYYWQHYMAKTTNATQEIPNLYFGNYEIQTYSNTAKSDLKTISATYPDVICSEGSRTITAHNKTHPNDNSIYNDDKYFGEYQGVNYGEAAITSGEQGNIEILFEEEMNKAGIEGYYLIFTGNQMQLVKQKPMKVSILDNTTDASATTHILKVVNNKGDEGYTYVWYSNGKQVGTDATYNAPIGTTPQLIYVVATETATSTSKNTEAIGLPRSINELTAEYSPKKLSECENKTFNGVFTVTPDAAVTGATGYTMSYAWQEWTPDVKSTFDAEEVLEINKDYIQSVKKTSDGTTVSTPYTSDIYTNADQYTITYKQVDVTETITAEAYSALSSEDKAKCTANDDGTYAHSIKQPYTPVKVGDLKIIAGNWGALKDGTTATTGNATTSTTSGAFDTKTYKCIITATDTNWQTFLTDYALDTHFTEELKTQYPATFTYELLVKLRLSNVVFLHPTQSEEYGVPAGKDDWGTISDGFLGDKTHPVKTWGKAYSLLDGSMGADWDDNKIVLVGRSERVQTWGVNSDGTICLKPDFNDVSTFGLSNVFATGTYYSEADALRYDQYIATIAASPMGKNVTISGQHEGVDYNAVIVSPQIAVPSTESDKKKQFLNFYGNTKFENLTFYGSGSREYDVIMCHYHDLWMGDGLIMKNFKVDDFEYGTLGNKVMGSPRFQIFGGMNMDKRFNPYYDAKTGKLDEMLQKTVPNGEKGFTITIRSGFYSIICTGSRQIGNAGMQGSPNMPIKCTIDVDLDQEWNKAHQMGTMTYMGGTNVNTPNEDKCTPYDIALIMAGNHEGPIYADVDINVKSGRIGRIVNGSLGALRAATYKYGGGTKNYPQNTFFGRANILLDPTTSRFASNLPAGKTTDDLVIVTELYNGGVGRALGSDGEINMPSISKNTVLMKGGTIGFPDMPTNSDGSSTGWDATSWGKLINSDQIICGLYGGGAGGMNGIGYGDATAKSHVAYDAKNLTVERYTALLPYWEDKENSVFAYGSYADYMNNLDEAHHLTVKCYNADTKDYTYFDPLDASSEITIEGGKIGDQEKNIHASIFGAGSGFTSTQFLPDSIASYPNTRAGNVYGRSKDAVVATINIKGGTVYGNVYGAGKGTDYYYTTSRSSGTPSTYTALGQTYGSVITNITGGIINGNVYGAGAGVAEAKLAKASTTTYGQLTETAYLSGNATVTISGNAQIKSYTNDSKTYGGNVYGGGMLARVDGNTNVNISGTAQIAGNVFGAAQGITNKTNASKQNISGTTETYLLNTADNAKKFGIVTGNTNLTTSGTPTINGDIYGGAESAITEGNTSVTINGGIIKDVYGGGLGSVGTTGTSAGSGYASANVWGNTTVKVTNAGYYIDTQDDTKSDKDDHFIYGGGNAVSVIGHDETKDGKTTHSGGSTSVTVTHGIGTDQTTVFGGGYGAATSCDYSNVFIKSFPANAEGDTRVYGLSSVYGGGNQGVVKHLANVNINGGLILHDVFGGGNEAKVGTAATGDQLNAGTARNEWAAANGTSVNMKNAKNTEGDIEVDIPSDAIVYGNIYGGGNKAEVNGNASVHVQSGKFGGDIFGGGNGELKADNTPSFSANVTNNTSVTVDGAMVIWKKKWDASAKQYIEWDGTWDGTNRGEFVTGSEECPIYLTNHNIYGGGNKACVVTGQNSVEVKNGFADDDLVKSLVWKNAFDDNTHPHFYVFGGGYGAFTSANNTVVNVGVNGKISEDATTEDQLAPERGTSAQAPMRGSSENEGKSDASIGVYDNSYGIPNFTVLGVVGGGYAGLIKTTTDVTFGGKTYTHNIYGGGYGQLEAYKNLDSTNPNVSSLDTRKLKDVLGEVGTDAKVNVFGGYIYGNIFGGGAGVESVSTSAASSSVSGDASPDKDFPDMGRVRGTTSVEVSHTAQVFGNVYGGGDVANVGVAKGETDATGGSTVGFGDGHKPQSVSTLNGVIGAVTAYTTAEQRHAQAFVSILGGNIFGQVFAGGNGRLKAQAKDYTKLGRIEGNTLLHVAEWNKLYSIAPEAFEEESSSSEETSTDGTDETDGSYGTNTTSTNVPSIWGRIYGGCSYGTVDGNTLVHIEGGMLGLNIFGGGYGDVPISDDETNSGSGVSTSSSVLEQVLGRADSDQKGTYANILGNTKVQIDGGSWIWNRKSDTQGNITTWKNAGKQLANDATEARTLMAKIKAAGALENKLEAYTTIKSLTGLNDEDAEFFDLSSLTFKKNHNIFGGGNRACLVGTYSSNVASSDVAPVDNTGNVEIIINHSPVTAIDDGAGKTINMLDAKTLGGMCWYLSTSNVQHPQFSVFGAGYGANTKVGSTDVRIQPGAQLDGKGSFLDPTQRKYVNEFTDLMTFFNFENEISTPWDDVTDEYAREHYGAGNNDTKNDDFKTFLRFRASQLAWSLGAPNFTFMDIHGGGYSGYVQGNTNVTTDCQLACRNVFGAGLGAKPADTPADQTAADKLTFGSVGGDATVLIKSGTVSLNVFGGGAGVESIKYGDNYLDFPNVARVNGKTNVKVYGEMYTMPNDETFSQYMPVRLKGKGFERVLVFGSVYGGGDVANVGSNKTDADIITSKNENSKTYTTTVGIYGASILSQAYAGGSGRLKSECNDYTKLGAVYGNTRFILDAADDAYPYEDNYITPPSGVVKPYMWNRIYGGCQNGTVYGNTLVHIKDGWVSHNIFGGGWGNVSTDLVSGQTVLTSADVTGNTNILITGGEAKMSSYWDYEKRAWWPAVKSDKGLWYSPQYDPVNMKFLINHNVYGGGNAACEVKGNTYITMVKGLLFDNTVVLPGNPPAAGSGYNFFAQNEWKEVYNKVGSPHFCVFGGGYGEKTNIVGDTHVDVNLSNGNTSDAIANAGTLDDKTNLYKHFKSKQSVMDIVGGGFNGSVKGQTNVNVGGETFCRRVFGGGFYAPVGASNVTVTSVDCNDIFGGGLMGDIGYSEVTDYAPTSILSEAARGKSNVTIGSEAGSNRNNSIYIHNNVYGGNDVSGAVKKLATVNVYGGHIFGNVYGAGNGDYLYALAQFGETKVTVNDTHQYGEEYDLVYSVPMRESMASAKTASDAQKLVNINSWRPVTLASAINIKGNDSSDKVIIVGKVFGGGNSATVSTSEDAPGEPSVAFNIGNHVLIGEVFMGSDGDALFENTGATFLDKFRTLNNLNLSDPINWESDPANHGISRTYLPTKNEDRPTVYPHLLDLYFQPVAMNVQASLMWAGAAEGAGLTDCTIGTFCCGGNRGNMNVYPAEDGPKKGNVVDYIFPAGLTITNKIVGGCNNANYEPTGDITAYHTGGYLLGKRDSDYPMIKLTVKNQFLPSEIDNEEYSEGLNVYGGCFKTGTINGDVMVDFRSDMLAALDQSKLDKANEEEIAVGNIYGAGYGMESYVYGNVKVLFGAKSGDTPSQSNVREAAPRQAAIGTNVNGSANYVFGGGQQGNVIGNTLVRIYNGHINKSVAGGSYAGYQYGSTQVLVGYPQYYTCQKTGVYNLRRADKWNSAIQNHDGSEAIKTKVFIMKGDIVSTEVYDAIRGYDADHSDATPQAIEANFGSLVTTKPSDASLDWDNIAIKIDNAVYGGGYSLASNSAVAAGTATVLKYNEDYNLDDDLDDEDLADANAANSNQGTQGFGGNTTVLVWDNTADGQNKDHIEISSEVMSQVNGLKDGDDIFKYYYKTGETYNYVSKEDTYFYSSTENDVSQNKYHEVYESHSDGGLYGDGHLSFAAGFRAGEINGYGFSGTSPKTAKVINTFQRMDMLRVQDCSLALLGARDYTVYEISTDPYSVSRIAELQMVATKTVAASNGALNQINQHRSRNYLGFANNIHYVGAVTSNVAFSDPYRDRKGEADAGNSYQAVKQSYINRYKTTKDENTFQKRNDGTAKNMIGISSGYALKLQNVYTQGSVTDEKFFYGPIVGVVEMNLINVHADEGGGYVYADNIHHIHDRKTGTASTTPTTPAGVESVSMDGSSINDATKANRRSAAAGDTDFPYVTDVPATKDQTEDFLETSGNFVFPYEDSTHRYIVDDCFPTNYYSTNPQGTGVADDSLDKGIHYWYVTGFNYYYNARITGYTFDSSSSAINFYNNNKDNLMVLSGALSGQIVNLQSIKWRSNHEADKDGFVACDLETTKTANSDKENGYGNTATDGVYDHYNLFVNAPVGNDGYSTDNAYIANLPLNQTDAATYQKEMTALTKDEPSFTFMLSDQVDNSGNDYYEKYMQQPCEATLVFTVPAKKRVTDSEGKESLTPVKGYVSIQDFYTYTGSGTSDADYTKATSPLDKEAASGHYYYKDNDGVYKAITFDSESKLGDVLKYYNKEVDETVPVNGRQAETYTADDLVTVDGTFYVKSSLTNKGTDETPEWVAEFGAIQANVGDEKTAAVVALESIELGTDHTYYFEADRTFTYTVYLTIDYIQGPSYTGQISVENCALPGEMIKLSAKGLQITSDASLSPDGYYWRIGPRQAAGSGYEFVDNGTWSVSDISSGAHGYDTYRVGGNEKNGLFAGCKYNRDDNSLEIPAYYFMNGYGVQYGFTVSTIGETLFPIEMTADDKLLIHNYHQMKPRSQTSDVKLHLAEALARAKDDSKFAGPRIYLYDATDLNEFTNFIDTIGAADHAQTVYLGGNLSDNLKEVPTNGEYAQFILQNDITAPAEYAAPTKAFNGILHGNGHLFTGLSADQSLFSSLGDEASIHNLGLVSGYIAQSDIPSTGNTVSGNDHYHCCFTYGNRTVYRINGRVYLKYTDDDFHNGRVAYDLNEYYLYRRWDENVNGARDYSEAIGIEDDENDDDSRQSALRGASAEYEYKQTYVEDYFRNGDYRYARRNDSFTQSQTGITYLRTTENESPAYFSCETRHDTTHPADEARSLNTGYYPLFNQNHLPADNDSDPVQNDYIFFGQKLQKEEANHDLYPFTIVSRINSLATNRVWRTSGFYGDKRDTGFHFNAYKQGTGQMATCVHDATITAIDFTGYRDGDRSVQANWTKTISDKDNFDDFQRTNVNKPETQHIFYAPAGDLPELYDSFSLGNGVTRNLLVYTNPDEAEAKDEAYDVVNSRIAYDADKAESSILGHHLLGTPTFSSVSALPSSDYTREYFHLVERTTQDKDSEGGTCSNNDFNCPIPFEVTERAWYTRVPIYYSEASNTAWEGLCLPFPVNEVKASFNGEISHFYGADKTNGANKPNETYEANTTNVGHEYWLRGMTKVTAGDKTTATFVRPGTGSDLFAGGMVSGTYKYSNSHFHDYYGGDDIYDKQSIYTEERTYKDYAFQDDHIPYLVSFPGSRYKEFDLSGDFNRTLLAIDHSDDWDAATSGSHAYSVLATAGLTAVSPQTVTFAWDANATVMTDAAAERLQTLTGSDVTIPVSDDFLAEFATKPSGIKYQHHGTFAAYTAANLPAGTGVTNYVITRDASAAADATDPGICFSSVDPSADDAAAPPVVLPFRTYMQQTSAANSAPTRAIYIGTLEGDDAPEPIDPEEPEEPADPDLQTPRLDIYVMGRDLVVESNYATRLDLVTPAGARVRTLEVRPGRTVSPDLAPGVYIVHRLKVVVR